MQPTLRSKVSEVGKGKNGTEFKVAGVCPSSRLREASQEILDSFIENLQLGRRVGQGRAVYTTDR